MTPSWILRLERRAGGLAIEDLSLFIVVMNAAVWALSLVKPEFPAMLTLLPDLLLRGQIWRALTFLFVPPPASPLWMLVWLYMLYVVAGSLEREWGVFRFNLFYALGALSLLAASLAFGVGLPNTVLNGSLFLAFAAVHPETEILLFFVLPVKVRWLGIAGWVWAAWLLLAGDAYTRLTVISGLANYAVFFGPEHFALLRSRVRTWLWERRNR